MRKQNSGIVFFRNDDVNSLDDTFIQFVQLFTSHKIPLVLAVEPANVTPEMVRYLLDAKAAHPDLIEIIQHGWAHTTHDRGEFGGNRGYVEQLGDISRGLNVMQNRFGEAFSPAFTSPFGLYNKHTIRILNELGFKVFSAKFNTSFAARVFYFAGRLVHKKWLCNRRISYHLRTYPGSSMHEISVSISPIQQYIGPHGSTECIFESLATLKSLYRAGAKRTPVVGIVLHHRYHDSPDSMSLLKQFVEWISTLDNVQCMTLHHINQTLRRVRI